MPPVSVTSQQIRICPCGQPVHLKIGDVRGGRVGNMDQNSFMESLDSAVKSRSEVPQMLATLANEAVTRSEFELSEAPSGGPRSTQWAGTSCGPRIAELEAKVEALLEQLGNPEPAKVKPAKAEKPAKEGK
jgi:hypothetical protein